MPKVSSYVVEKELMRRTLFRPLTSALMRGTDLSWKLTSYSKRLTWGTTDTKYRKLSLIALATITRTHALETLEARY